MIKFAVAICVLSWLFAWWLLANMDEEIDSVLWDLLAVAALAAFGWYITALGFANVKPMAREVARRAMLAHVSWFAAPLVILVVAMIGAGMASGAHFSPGVLVFPILAILLLGTPVGALWFTVKQAGKMAALCYNARLDALRIHAELTAKAPSDPQSP